MSEPVELTIHAMNLLDEMGFKALLNPSGKYILYDHGDYIMGSFTAAEVENHLTSFTTTEYMRELSI